ncbi:MAG: hypothetical protein M1830_009756, partial [Pleopsidium flavum]
HYYDRVIEKFEEAVEHDCKWIKELDANWVVAVKEKVSGPAAAEGESHKQDDGDDEEAESGYDEVEG